MTFMIRPSVPLPTGTEIGRPGVGDLGAAREAFGGVHGDAADRVFAQVLRDFEDQRLAVVVGFQRVQDRRQVVVELNVDDGADDLRDLALSFCHCSCLRSVRAPRRPK